MKQFYYTAKEISGKILTGTIEANDRRSAIRMIRDQDCFVTHIKEVTRGQELVKKGVSLSTLLTFSRKLKVMLEAGIDMLAALRILWAQTEDQTMQVVISNIRSSLSKGMPLTEALKRFPNIFPDTYISLISVGEQGGVLPFSLEKIMDYLIRQQDMRQKFKKALMYPTIVFAIAVVVVAWMFLYFIPMFENVFRRMRIDMPALTQFMIDASHSFKQTWWIILGVCVILVVGFIQFQKSRKGKYLIHRNILNFPVVGPLFLNMALSRFVHTFGVLLKSGVPLIDTLGEAARSTGNLFLTERLLGVQAYLNKGERLNDALTRTNVIPDFALSLILIGEETGKLADVLEVTAGMVDEEAENSIAKMTTMIGPLSTVIIGVLIGTILFALYSPIMAVWSELA